MKTIIATIIVAIAIVANLTACMPDHHTQTSSAAVSTTHTIVALDLSDRIHNQETVVRDILVVKALFDEFLAKCREEMFVDCENSFTLTLVPQRGDSELKSLLDSLNIDLAEVDDMQKRTMVENYANRLDERLKDLYAKARRPKLSDYDGACIWRFMNSWLPAFLDAHNDGGRTELYLLSDGLVEVDSPQARVEVDGRHNFIPDSTMSSLRRNNSWRTSDRLANLLILPENLTSRADSINFCLIGLQGRSNYALEADLISTIWSSWIKQIPPVAHFTTIGYDMEMSLLKARLKSLINNFDK